VHILEPSNCLQNNWVKSADLSTKLLTYLNKTGWRVSEVAEFQEEFLSTAVQAM
jgi:hypothetical protein